MPLATPRTPTRTQALRIVEAGHREVRALVARLSGRAMTTPGLGGGTWSPKDLLGHLAAWEERAVEAMRAWDEGHGPAFEKEMWSKSTNRINQESVERNAKRSTPEIVRRADATHEELVRRIREMSDLRWRHPGTPRGRKPVGERLGGILSGPGGAFRHADAHLPDLRAFVHEHERPSTG